MYIAQGLPIGLFQVAIPAWLASQGLSVAEVGSFIAIVFLPWSFKLLAGPIMDRFSFPPMGRRRPWVLGAQSGIVLSLLLITVIAPDPKSSFMLLAALGFCANTFGAIQDVAVDGMAIDILEESERAQANAYMFGGQVIGVSGSTALGALAIERSGLGAASLVLAILVALIMLVPLFLREREGERILPWTEGSASKEALDSVMDSWFAIVKTLVRAMILPMSLLLIVLEGFNRISAGMLLAISPVLIVQDLGWSQMEFSQWLALSGVAAAIFGVAMGAIVDRVGAGFALTIAVFLRVGMFLGAAVLQSWWQEPYFFKAFIMLISLSGQIVTIAIIALFMQVSFSRISATQFAVYMALANLLLSLGSALVVPMDGVLTYEQMFYVMAAFNGLFLLLWPLLNLQQHREDLRALESSLDDS